ncbi:MAG: Holliday junction resolvase RuvX [Burkholderiales bacterium]|nr:Holliday junction resolvase RuvX [Burkholderiales bacterium]
MTERIAATVLAFDFGTRHIGVAIGNTLTRTARALTTIHAATDDARLAAIEALTAQWQPQMFVVGIPVHADGTPHEMTALTQRFAQSLEQRFRVPVRTADERYTTQAAQAAVAGKGRADRARRDEVAAQIILQGWLDDGGR